MATTELNNHHATPSGAVEVPGPAANRARIPADVEAPDRILAGLTSRQVAVLAVAAAAGYLGWHAFGHLIPTAVMIAAAVPAAGLTLALVLGRRDGLGLDVWLGHAATFAGAPRRLLPARVPPIPAWAPNPPRQPTTGELRLPADAIQDDGVVRVGRSTAVAVVAATTVNTASRTGADRAGLVAGFAGWLNGLTGPAQLVVGPRPVDLTGRAVHVATRAHQLADPALSGAATGYAQFLLDLAATQPLARTVTATTAGTGPDAAVAARRAGEQTATALAGLGSRTQLLDGPAVTALLATVVDPFAPTDPTWARAVPGEAVRGRREGEQP